MTPPRREICDIQILRAIAAIGVVYDHAAMFVVDKTGVTTALDKALMLAGYVGVWIFFVISGFIMAETSARRFATDGAATNFLSRRALRILPIYAIGTMAKFALSSRNEGVGALALSLLFIPHFNSENLIHPVLGQGWTLTYEAFFYLVFSIGLFFKRPVGLTLVFVCMIACIVTGYLLPPDPSSQSILAAMASVYQDPIILLFLAGIAISIIRGAWIPKTRFAVFWPCLVAYAAIFIQHFVLPWGTGGRINVEEILLGTLATIIVFFATSERVPKTSFGRKFVFLGEASFSIYIFHSFFLTALERTGLFSGGNHILYLGVAPLCATLACIPLYLYLELPLTRVLTQILQRDRAKQGFYLTPAP